MKSSDAMVEYIAERVGLLYYHRPLMYGGTAAGVETLLYAYHDAWSFLVEWSGDWRDAWWKALEAEDCGSADFSHRFAMRHPEASEEEAAAYVVQHWRQVSDQLGMPIPHAKLRAEFSSP